MSDRAPAVIVLKTVDLSGEVELLEWGGGGTRLSSEQTGAGAALQRRSVTGRRRCDVGCIDTRATADTDDSLGAAGKSKSKETGGGKDSRP